MHLAARPGNAASYILSASTLGVNLRRDNSTVNPQDWSPTRILLRPSFSCIRRMRSSICGSSVFVSVLYSPTGRGASRASRYLSNPSMYFSCDFYRQRDLEVKQVWVPGDYEVGLGCECERSILGSGAKSVCTQGTQP
jgi:hypothetical protein